MDFTNTKFEIMENQKQTRTATVKSDDLMCKISPRHTSIGFDLPCNLWCTLKSVLPMAGVQTLYINGAQEIPQNTILVQRSRPSLKCRNRSYQGPKTRLSHNSTDIYLVVGEIRPPTLIPNILLCCFNNISYCYSYY